MESGKKYKSPLVQKLFGLICVEINIEICYNYKNGVGRKKNLHFYAKSVKMSISPIFNVAGNIRQLMRTDNFANSGLVNETGPRCVAVNL